MAAPSTLRSVLSILRKDTGIANEFQGIDQLAWMLLLKALDDRETEQEILDERYRSPIPERFRWRSFANDPALEGPALLAFPEDDLFPALAQLPASRDPVATLVRNFFQLVSNHLQTPAVFRRAIDALNHVDLNHLSARRALQAEFEALLGESTASEGSAHHAPLPLARFLFEMLDPALGEAILDPSCGSGALLVAAVERLRDRWVTLPEHETTVARSIFGATPNLSSWHFATTNLLLHGLVVPEHVRCEDALRQALSKVGPGDRVDVLVSVLPFGGSADPKVADGYPVALRTTDLGALHLQHAMHVLRPEGRAALVLPDSALGSNGIMTRVREKLLEECDVHTIVRLPAGVFAPHSNSRSCILFFTRGRPTKEIWYYEQQPPEGLKAYSKKSPLKGEDWDPLRTFWNQRAETEVAFRVTLDTIQARNYNLDVRHPRGSAAVSVEVTGPPSPPRHDPGAQAAQIALAARGSMRVRGVRLRDYRGFAALDLELPKAGAAVLIGINGAGKSTVLDAIAQVLAPLAALASGGTARGAEIQIGPNDVRVGEELARDGITLDIEGALQHWEVRANRAKGNAGTAREIATYARVLTERLLANPATNLPLLCYYPANRGLGDESGGKRAAYPFRQQRAYDRAFRRGLGPFQDFLVWFRDEEDLENQVRLRSDPTYRNPRLEVVRRAVQRFLGAIGAGSGRFSEFRIERFGEDHPAPKGARKEGVLIVEKDGTPLRIEQLSEGEKNTILLVSDLARRLSEANPGREDPLTGNGIVLIDEIDAHLHPGWQRGFLPALEATFPGCQLIVSTHSPQVLSHVHREHVFIFENFKRLEVTPYTYGRDSNSILSEIMDLPERPDDVTARIYAAAVLIDAERFDEARAALKDLGALLGEHDDEVVRLKTALAFLDD
jgi:type I restriction enzyme M protein